MKVVKTLTLNELATRMRALGIKTSNEKLAAAIEAGLYPFAICVRIDRCGGDHRTFEIYEKLFQKWVDERSIEIAENSIA